MARRGGTCFGDSQITTNEMSKRETPLLRAYWHQVGGILIEEFLAVDASNTCGPRRIDGIIIRCRENRIARRGEMELRGKHVTVVQVKAGRLGMSLIGQAFFSRELMKRFKPASIQAVALCTRDDSVLRPLFERHTSCKVVVIQP